MKIIHFFILILLLILIQAIASNFLPIPFNLLNPLILIFVIEVYLNGQAKIGVFLTFCFVLDLFSLNIFGVNLLAFFFTWLIMMWLMNNYLSNYHFYTVFLSSIIASSFFRFIYLIIILLVNFFVDNDVLINSQSFINLIWEGLITATASVIVYLIFFRLLKAINPSYIFSRK